MCDKNCGMCIYFKYTTKENWVRSAVCNPASGIKYNKDFFNEICNEFSSRPNSSEEDEDSLEEREAYSILSSNLRSL